jgi:hypothetical protein
MNSPANEASFAARHSTLCAFVAAATLAIALGTGFAYSDVYDVSAMSGHNPLVAWLLREPYVQSLHRHASNIAVPRDLMAIANVEAGVCLYASTCAQCLGVPGQPLSPIGQGVQTHAPELLSPTRSNNPKKMF